MYLLLIIVHVLACLMLIAVILLQAGRGGGLTQAFGGDSAAESFLGTRAPEALKKATEVAAVIFLLTSLSLAVITARRGRSLFHGMSMPEGMPQQGTALPAGAPPIEPVEIEENAGEEIPVEEVPSEEGFSEEVQDNQ